MSHDTTPPPPESSPTDPKAFVTVEPHEFVNFVKTYPGHRLEWSQATICEPPVEFYHDPLDLEEAGAIVGKIVCNDADPRSQHLPNVYQVRADKLAAHRAEIAEAAEPVAAPPPQTEAQAVAEGINLLEAMRHLRKRAEEGGKKVCLMGLPRPLALRLAGERAQERRVNMLPLHIASFRNTKLPAVLLAIDDMPILAFPMTAPLLVAWTGERIDSLKAVEEHPVYPALPFSRRLADTEPNRLTNFARNARSCAIEKIVKKRPADAFAPALAFMPIETGEPEAPPVDLANQGAEKLADNDDDAFAQVVTSLNPERRRVIQDMLAEDKPFEFCVDNPSPALIERIAKHMEDNFPLALVQCAEKREGDSYRIFFQLSRRTISV